MSHDVKQVKSVCPYCGVGCGIVMQVENDRIINVTGDKSHPANRGKLCTKGLTCAGAVTAPGRLQQAFMRDNRQQEPVQTALDLALRETGRRLRQIIDTHGPDAVSLYVSGQMSLEAQYLANKLAKGFITTRHIESNSRLCMASAGSGYKQSLGADGPPGSYDDFEQADLFLVIGSNMADCHPILFLRMMARVKAGARLIVVDTRRTATAEKASLFLQIKPGQDLVLLNGLLNLLYRHGHTDNDFIERYTEGWHDMPEYLSAFPPEQVAAVTGLPEEAICQAAQWIGEAGAWMSCWTMGLNQSVQGTQNTSALCNLHLATGTLCRPGCGPFSLTGQPNAMGGREMGYMGPGLPGQRSLLAENDRRFTENVWRLAPGTLRPLGGEGTVEMFKQMAAGEIKACWIICTNPVASMADRRHVIQALERAELVITQDAFLDTETNRYADILLPGALWAEGEGVMINSERNLTLMQKAVTPPGESLPDWQIIARVACEMGYQQDFDYQSAEEVFCELQQFANPATGYTLQGVSYPRLSDSPVQWPSPAGDSVTRHPVRYLRGEVAVADLSAAPAIYFPTPSGKARFHCFRDLVVPEQADSEFPFILNTGRLQHQWHTMTKTGRIPALNQLNPAPFIEIHPQDAERLQIRPQQPVEIRSRRGYARLPASISHRVLPGHCFAPFHWNDLFGEHCAINAVTSDSVDPLSLQPALKQCAVSLVPVAEENRMDDDSNTAEAEPAGNVTRSVSDLTAELFAGELGLSRAPAIEWDPEEQRYLQGFLAGLRLAPTEAGGSIPRLPASSPLDPGKLQWVNGLLAGLYSRAAEETKPRTSASQRAGVRVLWCSTTGNAESLAARCVGQLTDAGIPAEASCMAGTEVSQLVAAEYVLLVASTFGDGDPPDNGSAFWQVLASESAPRLESLHFSVLALGDSSYDQFCGFGRSLDERLSALGATRLLPHAECDGADLAPASQWLAGICERLARPGEPQAAGAMVPVKPVNTVTEKYHRHHPYPARVMANRLLSGEGSDKETRQLIFSVDDAEFSYQAGDALGVWPQNSEPLVDAVILALQAGPDTLVNTERGGRVTLKTALTWHTDLSVVSRELAQAAGEHTLADRFPDSLQQLLSAGSSDWQKQHRVLDLLRAFPARIPPEQFVALLSPLRPRLYSISSSPDFFPGEVHLTVSVIRDPTTPLNNGVCSTFLADIPAGGEVPIFVQKSAWFRPPADDHLPLIMIGPGTGIAPFRAFLQHRQALGADGKNWLFFGEQHEESDFYYRQELEVFRREGILHRLDTAFSRDQPEKIYVQQRMLEQGEEFWRWLQAGASVCVCGDASRMAKDVHQTLLQIIATQGKMTAAEATEWLAKMTQEKRYLRDIY